MALDFDSLYQQMLGRTGAGNETGWWKAQEAAGADPAALQNDFLRSANQELMNRTQPVAQAQSMTPAMQGYQKSPYLDSIAKDVTQQSTQNLQENVLPGLRYGAMAAGGFGSSRQGLAEAQAVERSQRSLDGTLAGLMNTDYQADRGRALQQYQGDQQYGLGMGQLALGNQNSQNSLNLGQQSLNNQFGLGLGQLGLSSQQGNQNFFTAQRGQDLQAAGLGASLWNNGTAGYLSQGQGLQGIGSTQQSAAWTPQQNFSNLLSQYSGLGGGQTTTGTQGVNGASSALGGALAGAQLGNLWGGGNNIWGSSSQNNQANSLSTANMLQAQGTTPYGL